MKLAVDPYMLRRTPLLELPGVVAELGYDHIELSPREDFLPFFVHPRAGREQIAGSGGNWPPPACRSRRCSRCTGGRAPTRTPARRRCGTGTFHQGGDLADVIRYAGPLLTPLHLADSFDHTGSSGLRYIVNPPGSAVRVHRHLDVGQGEVDRDLFFATLAEVGFDGIATVCVFAWEERARESLASNREKVQGYMRKYGLDS